MNMSNAKIGITADLVPGMAISTRAERSASFRGSKRRLPILDSQVNNCRGRESVSRDHIRRNSGNLRVAFFLNLGLAILEIIGESLSNSLTILTGVVYDFADSIYLGLL